MEMEKDKIVFKGSHPDSLYRVSTEGSTGAHKVTRALRLLRWPVALIAVCVALATFVYFLMPENLDSGSSENGTYWEPMAAGVGYRGHSSHREHNKAKDDGTNLLGTKTTEIDFYEADKNTVSVIDSIGSSPTRKLPIPPVFPTHLTPEVQYGNEKADAEKRTPKLLEDTTVDDSTLKPHITQKPEKPLAIYFQDSDTTTATSEAITRAETVNDFTKYETKQTSKGLEDFPVKTHPFAYKEYVVPPPKELETQTEQDIYQQHDVSLGPEYPPELQDEYQQQQQPPSNTDVNFTSGHSKFFGISIEDAAKMKSTTQSSIYNTRVSPTLPTWRDGDDTTTKKYPTNIYSDVQCRSTRTALCRGVLPYDLAGAAAKVDGVEITSLMAQIDYLVATNCSDRIRHFVCALLEPECNPPPFPPKKPCYNLCKAIVDSCDGNIPRELTSAFKCKQYSRNNCVSAKIPCYTREFTCGDGSCIPRDWICDGRNDCPAGEDEQACVQCEPNDFKCPSGGCILKRWMCDGYKDCAEGEDESELYCGPRHVQAPADRLGEPGEEPSGSAPAPAVKRPNRVPTGHRKQAEADNLGQRENDSSKELLVTSYSNNAVASIRNFTPLPARLTPYNRTSVPVSFSSPAKDRKLKTDRSHDKVTTEKQEQAAPETKKAEKNTAGKNILERESGEDVNMGDLGFFDEFEKEPKPEDLKQASQLSKDTAFVPGPKVRVTKPPPPTTDKSAAGKSNKATNRFDKVIDGAALLRKASAAEAAETPDVKDDITDMNNTYVDRDDFPSGDYNVAKQGWGRAHTSPCPSGELRCVDGLCISLAQLCDGTIDCTDHADEDNCYT